MTEMSTPPESLVTPRVAENVPQAPEVPVMTNDEAWAVRETHLLASETTGLCRNCGAPWPCQPLQEAVSTTTAKDDNKASHRSRGVATR